MTHCTASLIPREIDPEVAAELSRGLGVHPVTAQVLAGRGLDSVPAARAFLRPDPSQLHDPREFRELDAALDRIESALGAGDRIAVYGDYDVDGVTGTALLTRALRSLGAEVVPYIPHRLRDGYGLNGEALVRLREEGCRLVVTVDNGMTRAGEIRAAEERGLAVVVTDHHEPAEQRPDCPVLNPKLATETYPFAGLCGCAVAFKLALALAQRRGVLREPAWRALWPDLLALTALGTVADVVPLRDENRVLVSMGLEALAASRHAGFRALLEVASCSQKTLRASDVSFRLGPRINAAGRLGSASDALDLLLCDDPARAQELAARLEATNRRRQEIERRQGEEAESRAQRIVAEEDPPALVLWEAGWHFGVVGIVAARLAAAFRRPALLLTVEDGIARASARSHGGVRLHEALERCSEHLLTHGGHALAAGCTLRESELEPFRAAFLEAVASQEAKVSPQRVVDAELPLEAAEPALAAEIESLRPFGAHNPEPVFAAFGLRTAGDVRTTGEGKHLSFFAGTDRAAIKAVGFHLGKERDRLRGRFDLAFTLRRGNGREPVELHVKQIVPVGTREGRP